MPTTCCSAMQFINHQFILHPKCITVLIWCQTSVAKGCFFVIQWSYQFSYQNIRNYIEEAGILCQYLLPIFIGANYLWLISESCPKKFVFSIFFMILYCCNHIFLPNYKNIILRCKLWTINSFCTQSVSLYWLGVKFLWSKDVFSQKNDFIFKSYFWYINKLFKI